MNKGFKSRCCDWISGFYFIVGICMLNIVEKRVGRKLLQVRRYAGLTFLRIIKNFSMFY